MAFSYSAFGLRIHSDFKLVEFEDDASCVTSAEPVDVTIRRTGLPEPGLVQLRSIVPNLWANATHARFDVPGVASFLVRNGDEILVETAPGISEDSVRLFLLGSAFGALLMQRGHLVLHGNAVRIGNDCMVCCGDSGAGKSTLAAGFMLRGHSVLADDVAAIDGEGYAFGGVRRIKLWRNVVERLGLDLNALKQVSPDLDKFSLPLDRTDTPGRCKVRWIYILQTAPADRIAVEPITGMKRFESLHDNTYRLSLVEGMGLKQLHLRQCGMLASKVHIARITRPQSGFTLDQLVDRLLEHMHDNP